MTFNDAVAEYLGRHPDADIHALTAHILSLAKRKKLPPDIIAWLAAAQRQGAEHAIDWRLRQARVTLRGVSQRRFVALLDEQHKHTWAVLEEILGDPARRQQAIDHAWAKIAEGIGTIQSQRETLLTLGEAAAKVDTRIREMLDAAFEGGPAAA